ncbi:MAG: TIGR00159 family protein [Deltaproteobacteria bacterium]|nr:MAG: TIGR00159 family protein [Deltaproteobacteria bacterium]
MWEILTNLGGFFARDPLGVAIDLADIGLVAFVIYRVLVLMRGTRAMQMGIGLAFVFLVYELARRFGLVTVWAILDAVVTYLVLIVVVIFQADIRRALMRVGRGPLWRTSTSARETHIFEEVIKASTQLAQKRVGALIVFERGASLDEFVEPGTELDAAVTKELLYSIFIPSFENPMHDGAVIIRDGRVAQAGAFLPLTVSPAIDRNVGTRHRAAIGITEETDAVVVVVSEERGAISLCVHGNIIRDLDAPSLRDALLGLFFRGPKAEMEAVKAAKPAKPEGQKADATDRKSIPGANKADT